MNSDSKDPEVNSSPSISNELPNDNELVPTPLNGQIDPVYEGKARALNTAIQEIGMGRYQWQLFVVVGGFGWVSFAHNTSPFVRNVAVN